MTDVFISYASEDRERAHMLARALEARGLSVWWDRKIITGQSFDQVIERELETAKSVVVLWSKSSISSEWVKNEAAVAAERGILVPALIDSIKPPLEFRRKQTAGLVGWDGDTSHWGFQALCDGVAASITGMAPNQMTTPPLRGFRWNRRWIWTLGAIVAVAVLVFGAYWLSDTPRDRLSPAQYLTTGQSLVSQNKWYRLDMQEDGNLVLYKTQDHRALWASGTNGRSVSKAIMQGDGNLVIYGFPAPIWASKTDGHPGSVLVVQDDGNVVIYESTIPIWATNTMQRQ